MKILISPHYLASVFGVTVLAHTYSGQAFTRAVDVCRGSTEMPASSLSQTDF